MVAALSMAYILSAFPYLYSIINDQRSRALAAKKS